MRLEKRVLFKAENQYSVMMYLFFANEICRRSIRTASAKRAFLLMRSLRVQKRWLNPSALNGGTSCRNHEGSKNLARCEALQATYNI